MSLAPGSKKFGYAVRETTLWEDILVEKNIVREDDKLVAQRQALEVARQRGEEKELSTNDKLTRTRNDYEELDKLEDEFMNDDEDERVLEKFRAARLEEMKRGALESRFGSVETLARDEFIVKVKESSRTGGLDGRPQYVIVELFKEGMERSSRTSVVIDELARSHPKVKFVRMVSDQCIQGWPDSNVPSVFVYHNGELSLQLIGMGQCGDGNSHNLWVSLWKTGVLPKPETLTADKRKNSDSDDDKW